MIQLRLAKRAHILAMLCEKVSGRSIGRLAEVSTDTVTQLLWQAGTLPRPSRRDGLERQGGLHRARRDFVVVATPTTRTLRMPGLRL